LKESK